MLRVTFFNLLLMLVFTLNNSFGQYSMPHIDWGQKFMEKGELDRVVKVDSKGVLALFNYKGTLSLRHFNHLLNEDQVYQQSQKSTGDVLRGVYHFGDSIWCFFLRAEKERKIIQLIAKPVKKDNLQLGEREIKVAEFDPLFENKILFSLSPDSSKLVCYSDFELKQGTKSVWYILLDRDFRTIREKKFNLSFDKGFETVAVNLDNLGAVYINGLFDDDARL